MNEKIELAKKEVRRILKKFENQVEFAYIYGSALTKKDPNDVDILFVLKDKSYNKTIIEKINKEKEGVYKKYKDVLIHIQPPQPLSNWWRLILNGEPWIIDSLKNPLIIKDTKKTLEEISGLVSKNLTFQKEEVAEKLLDRSQNYFLKNKNLLLNSIIELSGAATEAMQLLLIFNDKLILDKKDILKEIEKNFQKQISEKSLNTYKEIIDLEKKMLEGSLTEFTADNLDYYKKKVNFLIGDVQKSIKRKNK